MFSVLRKLPVFFIFSTIILILSETAKSATVQSTCFHLYSSETTAPNKVKIVGRPRWLMNEPSAIGDFNEPRYTITGRTRELNLVEVTNQCRTSECYLFSTINYLNVDNAKDARTAGVVISEPYLVAHKFLQHIIEGVWYGTQDARVIHDLKGGFSYEAVQLSRKVGLVQKSSWEPEVPFSEWDMNEIYSVLETKVPEWHNYLASLAQRYGSWDAAPVRQAQSEAYDQLKKVILKYTGPLPEAFTYNGSVFTPKEFEQKVGIPRQRILAIDNKTGYDLPSNAQEILNEAMVNVGGTWKFQTGDYNTIINETVRFIDAGHPVIMDFKWGNDGHSMLIVGYEFDAQNYVTRLKVMNSWGSSFANDGYAWYSLDDVWNNVSRVYKFGALN